MILRKSKFLTRKKTVSITVVISLWHAKGTGHNFYMRILPEGFLHLKGQYTPSVQLLRHIQLFATTCTAATQASLSITNSQSLPKLMSLSRWCHPTISSSVVTFSSCPQSFPASGSLQMSQLFASGGQSIGVSVLASVLPMNTQDWSALGWTG